MSRYKRTHFSEPLSYFQGREARDKDMAKIVPSTYKNTDYWWWLAGWNDRDMELNK